MISMDSPFSGKRYLVIYDIESNRARNKIVRLLEAYGWRVQKSAFECYLDDAQLSSIEESIQKIVSENDSVRIYVIRESCISFASEEISGFFSDLLII